MIERGFTHKKLDDASIAELKARARRARGDILTMTTLAASGHPGGSMSSLEMYLTLYACARVFPGDPHNPDRDRIVISHGHTSPGAYSALAATGFFSREDAITGFRRAGSIFEGHVERTVPGIEWGTGNLGQGLSVGCAFALGARLKKKAYHTFVVMGDGEQQKGQISEARRFAAKYNLANLTVLIDYNRLQISGDTHAVMPQNIKQNFLSDGWKVMEIDGHDLQEVYYALHTAVNDNTAPMAIIAKTVMGKGVAFMENLAKYHGSTLSEEQYLKAMTELGLPPELEPYKEKRKNTPVNGGHHVAPNPVVLQPGDPIIYAADIKTDNRSAFGSALKSIALANRDLPEASPMAVFDCDLATSVKVDGFESVQPDHFFQVGIQEHNAAAMSGALSADGVVSFFADFGVFGVCETYNQHRLSDINHANLKLVCTHVGLDVGEDGKTHQCIDYIGVLQNLFGFKIVLPADPNQTDRATRFVAANTGNFFLGMGRSKTPVITDEAGKPCFGDGYRFTYGAIDVVRQGADAAVLTCGCMLAPAVKAWEALKAKGISVRVLNVACPRDLDEAVMAEAAATGSIITYEDHNVHTGLGSIVANHLATRGLRARLRKLGVTAYGMSGPTSDVFRAAGLSAEALVQAVEEEVKKK
jgi:transketolase